MGIIERFKQWFAEPPGMWLREPLIDYRIRHDLESFKRLSNTFPEMPSGHVQCGICGDSMGISSIVGWCVDKNRSEGDMMYLVCPKCFIEGVDGPVKRFSPIRGGRVTPVEVSNVLSWYTFTKMERGESVDFERLENKSDQDLVNEIMEL